ncbi:MAG: Dabb family protein, partial [Fimbriiglobus sp.]
MSRFAALLAVVAVGITAPAAVAADKPAPQIGHMVFFKLKDTSTAGKEKLVAACEKYLEKHDGVVYFSAGVIGDGFKREVNDRDWDVALHLVFADKAAHDKYQDHPEHQKFIDENKTMWEKVRVF